MYFNFKCLNVFGFLLEIFFKEKYVFVLDLNMFYIGLLKKFLESVLKNILVLDFCLNKFIKNVKIL